MTIRQDSTVIKIYNDGLVVYLYDQSLQDRLRDINAAALVFGTDERDDAEALRRTLIHEHLIIAYELQGDDGIHCEIAVGAALSARERRGRRWLKKVQKGLIHLPSGALRVESANSCSLTDDDNTDEGQTVPVPPGEYLLSLYRVDLDDDEDDEDDEDDDNDYGPLGEVIVLTPADEAKLPKKWDPYLTWEEATGARRLTLPPSHIEDGVFHGSILREFSWDYTDLSFQKLRKLGVRFGELIQVEIDGDVQQALYVGDFSAVGLLMYFKLGPLLQDDLPPLLANLAYHDRQRKTVVQLSSWNDGHTHAGEEPQPICVRPLGGAMLPAVDESLLGPAKRLPDAQVQATILLATESAVMLGFDNAAQKHLGLRWPDVLTLSYGDITREIHTSNQVSTEKERFVAPLEAVVPENRGRVDELGKQIQALWTEMHEAMAVEQRNKLWLQREALLDEQHRLRVPSALLPTMPVQGTVSHYFEDHRRGVLWLRPLIGGGFFMDLQPGETVLLKRAG